MREQLSSRRVMDILEGVQQSDDASQYIAHVIGVYGFMTFRRIQELVDETIGGEDANCNSFHEYAGLPTSSCKMHFRSNRCSHQLEINTNHMTAGGIYYTSVALLDTIPRIALDANGTPVTRQRVVANALKLYDLDMPAYRAYLPYNAPDAPAVPKPLLLLYPTLSAARTVAEVGSEINKLKHPHGTDMDLIREALRMELAALLGPLEQAP
ncbi:MAG TPA: hypothetical protein PKV72_04830 [Candidatus Peribacteria bacterium]|nr:hypothetical protein [Candidatus Peribacteria bacterium]